MPVQTQLNSTRVDGTVAAPSIPDVSSIVQDTSDASAIQRPSGDDNAATNDNDVSYLIITIDNSLWPPSSWPVFRQPIRTNNDCEGWHRRLNHHAGSAQLNLYRMVQLLHSEAKLASLNVRLLSEGYVTRVQRRAYMKLHTRISKYWDEFEAGSGSAMSLLRACGRLCGVRE